MGDQIGLAVGGTLYYVPLTEFERIRSLTIDPIKKAKLFASFCRINTLYMIACAGSGHIGSSFSSMDIMSWLQLNELGSSIEANSRPSSENLFFSSKGHDAPALYSTLIGLGKLDFNLLHQLRKLGGLPGHPDIGTPHIVTNTGSLGMGISKAKGMIFADRLAGKTRNIYVLTGDGELQEGQFWESLVSAANQKMDELVVIIDHNKLQSDTLVSKVSDLGDLEAKLSAFGWHVGRCNGNDMKEFSIELDRMKALKGQPKVIIADTIKGKAVSFMEHTSIDSDVENYKFHSGAPTDEMYVRAAQELIDGSNSLLSSINSPHVELEVVVRQSMPLANDKIERLIPAYSEALLTQARKNKRIVALDADLILDTGLIPFQKEFPERFVECGIAEQDMVSQAGGMALEGLLPIVHSFSCFLSSRPNEQIYNNATEKKKIIYVGSLAGILPAGPGHSHQAIRDISALSAIPGLVMIEPSCEEEVGKLLDWAINTNKHSSYLRLTSVPWVSPLKVPRKYEPILGRGVEIMPGTDLVIIAYGPIMLALACEVSNTLREQFSFSAKVINLPWLNRIDEKWFSNEVAACKLVVSLDNQFLIGGQGDFIARAIASNKSIKSKYLNFGVDRVPPSGQPQEVLEAIGLTGEAIASRCLQVMAEGNQ
jgi:transketolase